MDDDIDATTILVDVVRHEGTVALKLYTIFVPTLGIFIISLNLLVVISSGLLLEKRQHPRNCYMLLGNMGLSNMLTGIAVVFGHFYPSRNDTVCAIQMGMIVSSTLVSVFSVLLVAIDRFLYIAHGLRYQQYIFPNRVRILIALSWIAGTIIGFLPTFVPSFRGSMTYDQCWFILLTPRLILVTTIIGIIPVFIVLILYSFILYEALKKVSELQRATGGVETTNNLRYFRGSAVDLRQTIDQDTEAPLRHQSKAKSTFLRRCCCFKSETEMEDANTMTPKRQPSKWKAIKIVLFTTGSFIFTWVPYFIASTMYVYCDHENNPSFCNGIKIAVASPLAILGFANSLVNPIIYAWWHTGFRTNATRIYAKRFEKIKCCRWCFNKSNRITSSTATLSVRTTNLSSTSNLSSGITNATSSSDADANGITTVSPSSNIAERSN